MHYQADQPNGHFISYRSDGSRAEEGEFQAGERHGRWTAWYPANKGYAEILYERGETVSRRDGPAAVSAGPPTR
jgi:antitoxin component YwqK of YwqJK toxin-antitoxin module